MGEIVARVVLVVALVVPFALIIPGLLEFFSVLSGWTGKNIMWPILRTIRSIIRRIKTPRRTIRSIIRRIKIARRGAPWWRTMINWSIVGIVAAVGVSFWIIATFWVPSSLNGTSNSLSELGAAIAGGAVVGAAVLLVERRLEDEARTRDAQSELLRRLREEDSTLTLRDQDLRNVLLVNEDFRGFTQFGAIALYRTRFDGSLLPGCNFEGRILFGVSFTGANLSDASFYAALLSGADFTGANLTRADLTAARLDRGREPITGKLFRAANLAGAVLVRANLQAAFPRG